MQSFVKKKRTLITILIYFLFNVLDQKVKCEQRNKLLRSSKWVKVSLTPYPLTTRYERAWWLCLAKGLYQPTILDQLFLFSMCSFSNKLVDNSTNVLKKTFLLSVTQRPEREKETEKKLTK